MDDNMIFKQVSDQHHPRGTAHKQSEESLSSRCAISHLRTLLGFIKQSSGVLKVKNIQHLNATIYVRVNVLRWDYLVLLFLMRLLV